MKFRDDLKESRDGYYVEYTPASWSFLASLDLVFVNDRPTQEILKAVEEEFDIWIKRFPVPLMASAWDIKENLIQFDNVECKHLSGFFDITTGKVLKGWRLFKDDEFPDLVKTDEYIDSVYKELPFKTQEQLRQEADYNIKKLKTGATIIKYIIILWSVIIPVAIAVGGLKYHFIELMSLGYCFLIAFISLMKILGKWPKSEYEQQQDEENRKKEHHHYHCKLNPAGFARLKAENFENEQIKRNKQEFDRIRCGDVKAII